MLIVRDAQLAQLSALQARTDIAAMARHLSVTVAACPMPDLLEFVRANWISAERQGIYGLENVRAFLVLRLQADQYFRSPEHGSQLQEILRRRDLDGPAKLAGLARYLDAMGRVCPP